jgi:hypothetical protein
MIAAAFSGSPSELSRPKLKRIEAFTSSSENPIARKTWDGSMDPEAQAEPVDAANAGCIADSKSCIAAAEMHVRSARVPSRRPAVD